MISGEPRAKGRARKTIRIRDDTHTNLQNAEYLLGLDSYDAVIFCLTNKLLEEWEPKEWIDLRVRSTQSVLQQVNIGPKKLN